MAMAEGRRAGCLHEASAGRARAFGGPIRSAGNASPSRGVKRPAPRVLDRLWLLVGASRPGERSYVVSACWRIDGRVERVLAVHVLWGRALDAGRCRCQLLRVPDVTAPNVFACTDYRLYLGAYYVFAKSERYGFSFRVFSKRAGLRSSNYLELVIIANAT
jgi:hypothetical protein